MRTSPTGTLLPTLLPVHCRSWRHSETDCSRSFIVAPCLLALWHAKGYRACAVGTPATMSAVVLISTGRALARVQVLALGQGHDHEPYKDKPRAWPTSCSDAGPRPCFSSAMQGLHLLGHRVSSPFCEKMMRVLQPKHLTRDNYDLPQAYSRNSEP